MRERTYFHANTENFPCTLWTYIFASDLSHGIFFARTKWNIIDSRNANRGNDERENQHENRLVWQVVTGVWFWCCVTRNRSSIRRTNWSTLLGDPNRTIRQHGIRVRIHDVPHRDCNELTRNFTKARRDNVDGCILFCGIIIMRRRWRSSYLSKWCGSVEKWMLPWSAVRP